MPNTADPRPTGPEPIPQGTRAVAAGWQTVVWNDHVNLMTYVVYVFRTYFGYDTPTAERLMHTVHEEGRVVVSHGSREQAETDTTAMHRYGLQATFEEVI